MKKFIFIVALFLSIGNLNAQVYVNDGELFSKVYDGDYIIVSMTNLFGDTYAVLDIGENMKNNYVICNPDGKKKDIFNEVVMLNIMSKEGWIYVDLLKGKSSNHPDRWLLKRK